MDEEWVFPVPYVSIQLLLVDRIDLVLLLGNVETRAGDFLWFFLGEGGHSSTTKQGGKYAMLGFCIICTSSLDELFIESSSGSDDSGAIRLHSA